MFGIGFHWVQKSSTTSKITFQTLENFREKNINYCVLLEFCQFIFNDWVQYNDMVIFKTGYSFRSRTELEKAADPVFLLGRIHEKDVFRVRMRIQSPYSQPECF